jgi:Protein of unknown function (DUF732)
MTSPDEDYAAYVERTYGIPQAGIPHAAIPQAPTRRTTKPKLRWTQKLIITGAIIATVGVALGIFANIYGPHYSAADKAYLQSARAALPDRADSDRIAIGKSICNVLVLGAPVEQVINTEVANGVSIAQAGSLIAAAETPTARTRRRP